ncbi:MAG: sugar phosphate nucleotidyltransferase [Patescibacteria group bacterium]
MKALIFAAGKGIRLMPLTTEVPKPMVYLLGKPLLSWTMDALPDEIDEVVVVVGYKGDVIRDYFGSTWLNRKISYVEQREQLGTGDALLLCRGHVSEGERFLLIYADDIHEKSSLSRGCARRELALFVARVEYPNRFGIVATDTSDRILGLEEAPKEPKSALAVAGAYLLDSGIFDYPPTLEPKGEYFINSMLVPYMKDREVFAETVDFWIPVGYPEDLERAEEALRAKGIS